jgi:hypothetical protein
MKNKLVVYTALFGDYDNLTDPQNSFEGCDFICFTDQKNINSPIWKIVHVESKHLSNSLMNRQFKLLPHKYFSDYEYSLYIDANILIKNNPNDLLMKYLTINRFAAPKHLTRDCIYSEAKECIALNRMTFKSAVAQMKKYKRAGMPESFGLTENGIMFRRHNAPKMIMLTQDWWNELTHENQRDQLSLPYMLWKHGEPIQHMDESVRFDNNYFEIKNHKGISNQSVLSKIKFKSLASLKRFLLFFIRF